MSAGARGPVDAWTFVGAVRDKSRSVTSIIALTANKYRKLLPGGRSLVPPLGLHAGVRVKSVMKFVPRFQRNQPAGKSAAASCDGLLESRARKRQRRRFLITLDWMTEVLISDEGMQTEFEK